jgi:type IV secretory pathway component VirB8
MKQYLENKELREKEEEKAEEEAKEEAKIEAVKQEKKEKKEKEEKMLAGGATLMMVMSCICLVALIYMVKSRRR